jgi:hypothetical protein
MNGGETLRGLCAEMALTAEILSETQDLAPIGRRLAAGVAALERATDWLLAADNAAALTAATPFLKLAGDVIGGWILGRQALAAAGSDDPWLVAKGALARLYASQVLSLAPGLADGIAEVTADLEATPAAALVG